MNVSQFTGLIPAKFEAVGIDPESGDEVKGEIKIKLNRLAFKTVTQEGFAEAMKNADTDPRVIGELLAGKDVDGDMTPGVLAWWEMFEDEANTQMMPITVDNIISLPYDFVLALSEAVMNKLFPGPAKAMSSLAGSARTERSNLAAAETSQEIPAISPEDTTSLALVASGE